MFTGREYAPFGFYEYRARAYNPTLGRFMSEDPKLFDAGDYNLFRYCHNDPVDFTDPMGLAGDAPITSPSGIVTYERLSAYLYGKAMAAAQWVGSDLMHANTASGAIGVGKGGYQYAGFLTAWAALKAGGTYGYKNIQSDRAHGTEPKNLRDVQRHCRR